MGGIINRMQEEIINISLIPLNNVLNTSDIKDNAKISNVTALPMKKGGKLYYTSTVKNSHPPQDRIRTRRLEDSECHD